MPILLCRFLAVAQLLRVSTTRIPSLNISSLPQPAVAAIPSLELSGNLTLPPSPVATTLHNTSNDILPPNYLIPDTNPLIILQINPSRHYPVDYSTLTYMIVHELDFLVQETIQSRGDSPLPEHGMAFNSNNVAVFAKSHIPGRQELTYGILAALLRGVWEITALFGPCELDMEVYIGRQDETHHRGHLALYLTGATRETA